MITGVGNTKKTASGLAALNAAILLFAYDLQDREEVLLVTKCHAKDARIVFEEFDEIRYARELELLP